MSRPPASPTQTFAPDGDSVAPDQVRVDPDGSAELVGMSRYADERALGEGGMGEVLLVRDRVIGRDVALKRMKHGVARATARARFAREARLQGQLEHPAVVPVYDVGHDDTGAPFFTMKRVRGESLGEVLEHLARGEPSRFSRRKLLSAFSQLCLVAHYAHERGVVHRDIKPANVMLGRYGEVYLLDWGVAKVPGEAVIGDGEDEPVAEPTEARTGPGAIMGTLASMAPEQAAGADVDARTDVYALGAVLFQILALEPLHPAGSFETVSRQIHLGVEARPSVRVPAADVPPELDVLCVEATRVRAEDRIPSALAFHEAIERYLDGDRDLTLRRASSRAHAEAARAAADALTGDPAAPEASRASALRDVGKSLAFDPANREALAILVRLLTTPPRTPPPEVAVEETLAVRRRIRVGGIALAAVYGVISINAWTTWAMGLRDLSVFAVPHLLWGVALVLALATAIRPRYVFLFLACLCGVVTSTYVTKLYSPFLIVPTLLTLHAALFAFTGQRRLRVAMVVAACVGWTLSVYGHAMGIFPETVTFEDRAFVLHAAALSAPPQRATAYVYVAGLAMVVAPALVVGALRSAWKRSEDALRLQAWQLRRLVSDDDVETSSSSSEPPT